MLNSTYTADLRDIEFVLFEQLEIQKTLGRGIFAHVGEGALRMLLQLGSEFASKVVAPTNGIGDRVGCRWENGKVFVPEVFSPVWQTAREQEWIGIVAPPEWGGQGLPRVIGYAIDEMIIGASSAFHTYLNLCRAGANMLLHWGSDELKSTYVPRLLSGEWQGTMCLTEPGAGSDVGASICRAIPVDGGAYRISGTKVFITGGEHQMTENHVHLVLARTPDAPAGVKGLSLFLVPKVRVDKTGVLAEDNDVYCSKIEEKLGIHGSATTVLNFGEHDRCLGYLVGEINRGIQCMFDMMNESRIGVGLQGQALAAAMFQHALTYARERLQGSDISKGKSITQSKVPIVQHPDVRRMLMNVRIVAEGGRALLYATSWQLDLAAAAEDDASRSYHEGRVALLTPICKAWTSDAGIEACSQALQIFGGSGYLCDYPAEQYLRDARITAIYEGTNGMQAIDLLFRKVLGADRRPMESWHADISAWTRKHVDHPDLAQEVGRLQEAERELLTATQFLETKVREDIRLAALAASPYLTMFGNVAVAWQLLQQAILATEKLEGFGLPPATDAKRRALENQPQARFYADKIETARFFVHQMLSQNHWRASQILSGDRSAIEVAF
jgi:alkylation response protein AidB-like acyl-CoA dehydrogenase